MMNAKQAKPRNCEGCGQSTSDLTEVVNPHDASKTMWVCDHCVKQGYVLATYARMKDDGELPDIPSSPPIHS